MKFLVSENREITNWLGIAAYVFNPTVPTMRWEAEKAGLAYTAANNQRPCLKQDESLRASEDASVLVFHLPEGVLELQTHTSVSSFIWVLGIWAKVLTLGSKNFTHWAIFLNEIFSVYCIIVTDLQTHHYKGSKKNSSGWHVEKLPLAKIPEAEERELEYFSTM